MVLLEAGDGLPDPEGRCEAPYIEEGVAFDASLSFELRRGTPRPPLLRYELWDKDEAAEPEAEDESKQK